MCTYNFGYVENPESRDSSFSMLNLNINPSIPELSSIVNIDDDQWADVEPSLEYRVS